MIIFFLGFLGLVICVLVLLVQIILVSCFVSFGFGLSDCEFHGRFLLVEFSLRGSILRVASIYAPNRNPDCDAFLVRCVDSIDPAIPTLLCSDFNMVLDRVVDRCVSCPFDVPHESSALLSAMFLDCCVVDIWRERHPTDSAFTWYIDLSLFFLPH